MALIVGGNLSIAHSLLDHHVDVNTRSVHGDTPLIEAIKHKRYESALLLLGKCDLNKAGALGKSPLSDLHLVSHHCI